MSNKTGKTIYTCTNCEKVLDGNPRMCPYCSYTVFRPEYPDREVTQPNQYEDKELTTLYAKIRAGVDPDTGELHMTEDEFVAAITQKQLALLKDIAKNTTIENRAAYIADLIAELTKQEGKGMSWSDAKTELLENPETKAEYEKLKDKEDKG